MTEYKIPSWLTAPERVKGEPLSRSPEWDSWNQHKPFDWGGNIEMRLRETITAFDAKCAELEEQKRATQNMVDLAEDNRRVMLKQEARAEKAEASLDESAMHFYLAGRQNHSLAFAKKDWRSRK